MSKGLGIGVAVFLTTLLANIIIGTTFAAFLPQQVALIFTQIGAVFLLAFTLNKVWDQAQVPHQPLGAGSFVVTVFALFAVAIFANLFMAALAELVPALQASKADYEKMVRELLRSDDLWLNVSAAFAVALVAPVCEEWLFRGALLRAQLKAGMGVGAAILVNGFLFSALHLNPIGLIPLWLVGSVLAWATIRTGSLWVAIIGHAALNTLNGVVFPWLIWDNQVEQTPEINHLLVALAVFALLVFGLIFFANRIYPRRNYE